MGVAGFRRLSRFVRSYDLPQEALGPVFVMRTRVSCGQGIGWRARAARRPARRSWRCHDSEPCDSRIGISSPGTRARLWRGFSRTDGCVGVAISTVGVRASLSPLRTTERPLLPPAVASGRWHNPCRRTPHDHPHGSDCPSPWRHARCPWSRPRYVRARSWHRRRCVPSCQSTTGCPSSMSASRDRAFALRSSSTGMPRSASRRRWCRHAAAHRGPPEAPKQRRIPPSSTRGAPRDAGSSRWSSRRELRRVRAPDLRTRASSRCRKALLPRRDRTGCTTAAGNKSAASRPMEMAAARHSDQPWDNGARSQLRARPKEPQQPSQPGTHHASCASSWPHSRATQNSAGPSEHLPESMIQVCHDRQLFRDSLISVREEVESYESFVIQERWPDSEEPPMWTNENRARYDRSHLRYPSDLTDDEWKLVEPLIPPGRRGGDKRTVIMREVVNGLMYILSTGCQWRAIPKDLPPRSTLYDYFDLWSWDHTLDLVHHELYVKCRDAIGREASPTAAVIDSQSVKSAEKGGLRLIRRATTRERRSRARSGTFSSIRKAC